jgi:CheY-like chemotaxis protein
MELMRELDVLLVEDSAQDAELAVRALKKRQLADKVFVVENGAEALDFVFCMGKYAQREAGSLPKVILLDLKLPLVSGLDVLRRLKQDVRTRIIPVVVITSSREERDIKEAYSLGANSFVVKPVDFEGYAVSVVKVASYWLGVNEPPV